MTEAAEQTKEPKTKKVKEVKEKIAKIEQNGVSRPKAGTATERVWAIADAKSQAAGKPATRKEVLDAALAEGLNVSTAATQYGRWCKFHGVTPEAKAASAAPASGDAKVEDAE